MEEFKPIPCFICLEVKSDDHCKVVEESLKEVLDFLLFKRPVEVNTSVICEVCCSKVFDALEFKVMCSDTEDCIFPYVNSENVSPIDLEDVYLKENDKGQSRSELGNKRVCRLCMQIVTSGFTSIRDLLETDLICIYIPEVNFNWTLDPIVCTVCVGSLKKNGNFLRNFSGIQKFENSCEDGVMEVTFEIKTEEIEIKPEDNDENETVKADESVVCKSDLKNGIETESLDPTTEPNLINHQVKQQKIPNVPKYKCDQCNYIAKRKGRLISHQQMHKRISNGRTYTCYICGYEAALMGDLLIHKTTHVGYYKLQQYKCDVCSYKTTNSKNLANHRQRHNEASSGQTYNCDRCSYETKYRRNLARHRLSHIEVLIYKCDTCGYEAKSRYLLKYHELRHKDNSEVETYACDKCDYKSKYKRYLVKHRQMHDNEGRVAKLQLQLINTWRVYKCDVCCYETKYEGYFARHAQKHKNSSKA